MKSCLTLYDPTDTRLLRPWDFLGKSTGVSCHCLLPGIFPTQGLNPGLLHCRQMLYCLSHQGSPTQLIFFFLRNLFNNILTGLLPCRELVRHSTRDKGHEEGGSAYAKAVSSLRSPPGYSRASTAPSKKKKKKKQSLPTLLLCALTSDFTGGCPPPPSRSLCQRVNLQLQLIKFLGN